MGRGRRYLPLPGRPAYAPRPTAVSLTASASLNGISLGDGTEPANFLGFRGSVPLLPHLCQLSVPEVGVCGAYSESP